MGQPPESLSSGDVVVRRLSLDDVPALHAQTLANLDHLRPWMRWVAREPLTLDEREAMVVDAASRWEDGVDFSFVITDEVGDLLGACGLHRRIAPGGLEIGYWVRGDRTGRGVATAAVALLVDAARTVDGIDHVEIHHDLANVASSRPAERNGFRRIGETPDEIAAPAEVGIDVTWRLDL